MLHVRPPCLLCNCPTANGGVHPSKVDRKKLDVLLGREVIDDHALICYFCIWQTQCLEEITPSAWSPRQMRLDSTTKQLMKHYFASNVRQCYVKLRQIDLPRHGGKDQLIIPPDFAEAARMCVKAVYRRPKGEDGYADQASLELVYGTPRRLFRSAINKILDASSRRQLGPTIDPTDTVFLIAFDVNKWVSGVLAPDTQPRQGWTVWSILGNGVCIPNSVNSRVVMPFLHSRLHHSQSQRTADNKGGMHSRCNSAQLRTDSQGRLQQPDQNRNNSIFCDLGEEAASFVATGKIIESCIKMLKIKEIK
ncbi:Hypothetical predicted protein [Cloeon dipterum]|uniref:Uncharacterized protein n=1 Tax=Cloeon dipterum TaxID=197152 RepID=A0A8S1DA57_9INSE|nr:Hypothetical predicted protein [Cloeon dipterum]